MLFNFIGNHTHLYVCCSNEKLQRTERHTLRQIVRRRNANTGKWQTRLEFTISEAYVLMQFVRVEEITALQKMCHLV